ncbi:MAG TPA: hypothetical protein VEQ66_03715 [Propionibacteriaceae bacterium]|nr:hypothetical protein [Propionibacteriaceae bacterium]
MKRSLLAMAAVLALVTALLAPTSAQSAAAPYPNLNPGGPAALTERVPVNVVLIGYSRAAVDQATFRQGLASRYEPVVSSRLAYGVTEKLGITYRYDYRLRYTDQAYENRFFSQLKRLSVKKPLTEYQAKYNAQQRNAVDVTHNYEISAPAVERWLALNPPSGVNTRRNTVFLINWYDRADFRFHVYTKQNEPDPDTGFNFGAQQDKRKVIAWGGTTAKDEENGLRTTRRVWFHDQSAGPESWAGGWNVDDADLDGDLVPDYRIPPVWEYGHYRAASALPADLAKLTRYVALDLLFTTSPAFPVELPTPELARTINIDSNTYEGWPGVDASGRYIKPKLLLAELRELLRGRRLDYDSQDLPFSGQAKRCFDLLLTNQTCYPGAGFPAFANLYLQNRADLARTQDDGDSVDYEMPLFNYAVNSDNVPILGFADDNYVDGTQSFVFSFLSPAVTKAGYGLTTTMIHEVGHHVGLSHPHDGYDSASGTDFEPTGDFFFAWAGDESNSVMSYIDLNWDFSQFDQDNLYRFQSAAALEATNRLAAQALAGPRPDRARPYLAAANVSAGQARLAFAGHDYPAALRTATQAYRFALRGAQAAGVNTDAFQRQARRDRQADRRAEEIHQPGDFIDAFNEGPRGDR